MTAAAVTLGQVAQRPSQDLAIEGRAKRRRSRLIADHCLVAVSSEAAVSVGRVIPVRGAHPERDRALPTAGVVDDRVRGDAVKEAAERLVSEVVAAYRAERPFERHRGEVFGRVALADPANDEAVDPRQIEVIELAERGGIDPGAGDKLALPGRVHA